jgi:hypothetical protein
MKKFSIWTLSAVISYAATIWIKSLLWNLIIGTAVWIVVSRFLEKWIEGEI